MKKNVSKFIIFWLVFLLSACSLAIAGDSIKTDSTIAFQVGREGSMSGHFYQVFLVTAILLLLLVGGLYLYKRIASKSSLINAAHIRVMAKQNIGPKQSIVIISIQDKKYALGVTDHAVNLIADLGQVSENDLAQKNVTLPAINFGSLLSRLKKEK